MGSIEEKQTFQYTYSAKQQEEIQAIRSKYIPREENKMERLRQLDRKVNQKATIVAIVAGLVGALLLGTGMSLIMTDLADAMGLQGNVGLVLGIIVGIIGMVPVCYAYPLYNITLRKERENVAPEIIRLTDELMVE